MGGETLTEEYYRLAGGPKQLWQIEGDHTGGIDAEPAVYEERVVGFFDDTLLGEPRGEPTE